MARRGATGATGTLRGLVANSLGQRSPSDVRGLLRWAWPWSIGDSGLLGRIPASGEYPISGIWLAGGAALVFILAVLAVMGWWVPFGWWRVLAMGGAILSFLLMAGFFGATKVLPMALDLVVLWLAITDRISAPATG
jgi:hypothetical protein